MILSNWSLIQHQREVGRKSIREMVNILMHSSCTPRKTTQIGNFTCLRGKNFKRSIRKADMTSCDGSKVAPQSTDRYFSGGTFRGRAARTAIDLEELGRLLGSTSHHSTEFLIVDPSIL